MNLLYDNDHAGQYPDSYYAATSTPFMRLDGFKGNQRVDICVIGGGYTGLSAALHLAELGYQVILLEAHRIGFGASGRNGGQVGSGQRREQSWLEANLGQEQAQRLWEMGEEAKGLVRHLIQKHQIKAGYRSGIVQALSSEARLKAAYHEAEILSRDYGYDKIKLLDQKAIQGLVGSEKFIGGTLDQGAGHLHPLNYAIGLAKAAIDAGVHIYENSTVTEITHGSRPIVDTHWGRVVCDNLIYACNGYLGNLAPKVAARAMPINNFMVATEPLGERAKDLISHPVAVLDDQFVVNYWRLSADNRLLFGGGESYGYRFPKNIVKKVSKPMLAIYPQLAGTKVEYAWGGTLAITRNRMPCFYKVATNEWSASGYSGHGVAMATLAGRVLADAIDGEANDFDIFAKKPPRSFPGGTLLRWPLLSLAMSWHVLRDKLGR